MATLKSNLKSTLKDKVTVGNIAGAVIGGALLLYAYKNRSTKFGQLASLAGTSLLGRTLGNVGLN